MPFVLRFTSDRRPFTAADVQRATDRIEAATHRVHTVRWTARIFECEFDDRKELNKVWHGLYDGLGHDLGSWVFKTYKTKR